MAPYHNMLAAGLSKNWVLARNAELVVQTLQAFPEFFIIESSSDAPTHERYKVLATNAELIVQTLQALPE